MIVDENDLVVVQHILSELKDIIPNKVEQMIVAASEGDKEGVMSFVAGQLDAINEIKEMIREKMDTLKIDEEDFDN